MAFAAARNAAALRRQCGAFNLLHPVGARVRAWPGLFREGRSIEGEVREPGAYVLSGHTAVVFVTGCRGCVAISHVEGRD